MGSADESRKAAAGKSYGRHVAGLALDIGEINGTQLGDANWQQNALRLKDALTQIGYTWITPYGGNIPFGSASYVKSERNVARAIIFGTSDHKDHLHVSRSD